jgi:hypothetical protein
VSAAPHRAPAIGDVLYLSDTITFTRLSSKSVMRWCVVVAVTGYQVRVVGRSASRRRGVFTPAGMLAEFDKDGCFWPASARISLGDAMRARYIGKLPEPYLGGVLAQVRRRRRKT